MEDGLFLNSLKMILDESNQFTVLMNQTNYIQEGTIGDFLKKIDLKKIFKFIFGKFIEIINNLWGKFKSLYNEFTRKSTLIKRYKKKLDNISWDIDYPEERSIYTNLDNSTNINLYNLSLDKEFSTFTAIMDKISRNGRIEDLYSTILSAKNSMTPLDDFLDQKRGESIGKYSSSKENYPTEVYSYFKSNLSTISPGIIHPQEVRNISNNYFNSNKIENTIINDKKSLDNGAKTIINKINSINMEGKFPENMNKDVYNTFTDIIREYCSRVQGLCNIYIQLFSIKLDVFKQYKEEQTKVLSKIILISMKEGKM